MSSLDAKLVHQISTASAETTALLSTVVAQRDDPDWVTRAGHLLERWQGVAVVINEDAMWVCGRCEGAETLDHSRHCPERYAEQEDHDIRAEDMTPERHYRAASQCLMDANTVPDGSKTQRAYLKFAEVHAMLAANPLFATPTPYKLTKQGDAPEGLRADTVALAREFGPESVVHRVLARWLDYT